MLSTKFFPSAASVCCTLQPITSTNLMYPISNKCGVEIYALQRKKIYVYTLPVEYITLLFFYIQRQDRLVPINMTFRSVDVTTVAVEKQ